MFVLFEGVSIILGVYVRYPVGKEQRGIQQKKEAPPMTYGTFIILYMDNFVKYIFINLVKNN